MSKTYKNNTEFPVAITFIIEETGEVCTGIVLAGGTLDSSPYKSFEVITVQVLNRDAV